jgi:hypothetical protein
MTRMISTTSHRIIRPLLAGLASVALAAVGCTSATTPAPSLANEASSSPAAIATPTVAASASLTPTASPSPTPATTPAPSPTPLPAVGKAPAGPWSALTWQQAGALPLGPTEIGVHGWSGGYVAFEQSPGTNDNGDELPVTIRASSSRDGITWTAPTTLTSGLRGMVEIQTVVEGPAGLLALAYHYGDTCGGPEPVAAMWSSADGRTWKRLAMPKAFTTGAVQTIAGGPAGFIALGTKSDAGAPAIWTSRAGANWASRPLPTVATGTLALDGVASFADGLLLVGAVLGEGGCGGPDHIHPAIWYSADASSWTRISLPGASTSANTSLAVRRFGDQLLAIQTAGDTDPARAWTSTDGRTWTRVADVSSDVAYVPQSDGAHAVTVIGPDSGTGPATVIGVAPDGTTSTMSQAGDVPAQTEDGPATEYAVGPTGLLAYLADGSGSWLGIPN